MSDANGIGPRGGNLSIMVPTFNCAKYLIETLNSLKAQGDSIADAQIEVIDDCSNKDDPESVVKEIWPGRVTFWRHPKNGGMVNNFNTCLERAQRGWIHVLHGDDAVLPDAYRRFGETIATSPNAAVLFTRSVIIDATSRWMGIGEMLGEDESGPMTTDPMRWRITPVQFAGVLISKAAIGEVGGFSKDFMHAADWNLWWRLARTGRGLYSNAVTSCYRVFVGNHSSTLMRTGKNIDEFIRQIKLMESNLSEQERRVIQTDDLYSIVLERGVNQLRTYADDKEAFTAIGNVLKQIPGSAFGAQHRKVYRRAYAKHILARIRGGKKSGSS